MAMIASLLTVRAATLVSLVVGLGLATAARADEFRSLDTYPANYPTVQAVMQMDKLLRERSGGRHGITLLGRDEQHTESDSIALLRSGRIDMVRVNVSALDTNRMASIVPSLPFLFRSTAHMRRVLDGPIGDDILASLDREGLVGLCFYDAGPRSFYSATRPIRTAGDLKGMKVRVQQSELWVALAHALGAEPVTLRFEQVSAALKDGTVEAADNNWPTYVAARHYNVAKYYSPTEHSMAPAVLLFSKSAWDRLSREDQGLIRGAAKDSVLRLRSLWDDYNVTTRKTVETAGGQIVTDVDRKSFADALEPLYASLVTDARSRDMVRRIQSEE
jgi:tripartite ATP-independent transporter DctP family solute receptor